MNIIFAILLVLLQFGDWYTTNRFLNNKKGVEANQIMANLYTNIGFTPVMILKVVLVSGISIGLCLMPIYPFNLIILISLCAWYAYTVWENWKIGSGKA